MRRGYILALWGYAPRRVSTSLVLLALVALTEGVGLLMLVPLLQLIGPRVDQAGSNPITNLLAQWYAHIHLPLTLGTLLATFVALITLRAVLTSARQMHLAKLQLGFVDTLRKRLYSAIGRADWLFLSRRRNAEFSHVLTSDILRIGQGTHSFLQLLVTAIAILAHTLVALRLSPAMTAIALLTGTLLLVLLWPLVRRARRLGTLLSQTNQQLYARIGDFLQGIKLAKSYAAEDRHIATFDQAVDDTRGHILEFTRAQATSQLLFQIGAALALSALLLMASRSMQLAGPELLVLVLVFARLLPMLSSLQRDWQQFAFMLPAFESAMAMDAMCSAAAETPQAAASGPDSAAIDLHRDIRLRNVHFRYTPDSTLEALAGIDLVIPARRTTALTGPSGAGKSTLADLLMGLLAPSEGEILIDGTPLTPQRLRAWRQNVAYVPQDTFLFHDSLRANLLWANPEASDSECLRVLRLAAADDFITGLPHGLDTVVGERGVRLSGGERQRIALARALLKRPALLLLDEATSALDQDNEARILKALNGLHGTLTIILIAHRLSTLSCADRVATLVKGAVVAVDPRTPR